MFPPATVVSRVRGRLTRRVALGRPSKHTVIFFVVLALYVLVTLGVIFNSPLLRLDTDLFKLDLRRRDPAWRPYVHWYVILGQRGPATLIFLPWFCWVSWRARSLRPLVMLATSLVMLNVSVGVVKLATGRLGPAQTADVRDLFVGGDIYPSGHVSNAVVLYGLLAMIAVTHRRLMTVVAVFLSVTVGMSTIYLDTHWFSDVLGALCAGGLVLLALPWALPWSERLVERVRRRCQPPVEAWWRRVAGGRGAATPAARTRPGRGRVGVPQRARSHRGPATGLRLAGAHRHRGASARGFPDRGASDRGDHDAGAPGPAKPPATSAP